MQTRRPEPSPLRSFVSTSALFVAAYAACNQLTHGRGDIGAAVFAWEQHMPFVPWTIVPYLSVIGFFIASFFLRGTRRQREEHVARMVLLLAISVACYALVPLQFQFQRPVVEGPCGWLYALLSACDLPYNRAPSLHIGVLVLLWLRWAPQLRGALRTGVMLWFIAIGLSVLTTWQHHVIDIPAGLAAAACSALLVRWASRATLQGAISRAFTARPFTRAPASFLAT